MSKDGSQHSREKAPKPAEADGAGPVKAEASEKPPKETPTSEAEHPPSPVLPPMKVVPHTFFANTRLGTNAEVDVCIIHCFTGDDDLEAFTPREPVKRPQSGPWLEDTTMVQSFAPDSRVFTLGFDLRSPDLAAGLEFDTMGHSLLTFLSDIRDSPRLAKRPLVLIGHGFGGTVIQQAVTTAQDAQNEHIAAVIGIIFIATPFDGSTSLVDYLRDVLKLPAKSAKLHDLEDKSTRLKRIYLDFVRAVAPESIRYRRIQYIERVSRRSHRHNREAPNLRRSESVASPDSGLSEAPIAILQPYEDNMRFEGVDDDVFRHLSRMISEFSNTHFLLSSAAKGHEGFAKIKEMITRGVSVNLRDRWGASALHEAVKHKRLESVQLLLLRGAANVNIADNEGTTPLHLAVVEQDRNIIDLLLRNGADVNAIDSSRQSPLEMSKLAQYAGPRDEIKELLQYRPLVEGPSAMLSSNGNAMKIRAPYEDDVVEACKETITVAGEVYFFDDREQYLPVRSSVWDLLYDTRPGRTPLNIIDEHRPAHLETPVCRWYHVPANNMAWIEDLFKRLHVSANLWGSQSGRQYRGPPHSRSIVSECVTLPSHNGSKEILAMFLPFVSYERNTRLDCFRDLQRDSRKAGQAWRDLWLDRRRADQYSEAAPSNLDSSRSRRTHSRRSRRSARSSRRSMRSVDSSTTSTSSASYESDGDARSFGSDQLDDAETTILQYYLYHEPPLHTRRTLDQAHYYMLKDTRHRDIDQVATRWADKHGHRKLHNVLMVDQLWLWIIRDKDGSSPDIVISSFPNRKGFESGDEDDLMLNVLSRQRKQRHPIRTSLDLATQIMTTCCNIFDRRQDREMLQFLNFYESAIGSAVNKEAQLFDRFADQARKLEELSTKHRGYQQIKTKLLDELFRIHDEVTLLREVKDIKDEIEIISSILTSQQKVLQPLSQDAFKHWRLNSPHYRSALVTNSHQQVAQMIDTAILDFTTMARHAESAEASLNHLLDLKNKEANLHEAHTSNERSEEAVRQGQTVLIFTMVTIIFLPLSFMSSFFALGVTSFPHNDDGELAWPLHEVSGWIFGMTFALAVPLLIGTFAISSGSLKTFYHSRVLPKVARSMVRVLCNKWVVLVMLLLGRRDKLDHWVRKMDRIDKELSAVYPRSQSPRRERRIADRRQSVATSSYYYSDYTSYTSSYYSYTSSDDTVPGRARPRRRISYPMKRDRTQLQPFWRPRRGRSWSRPRSRYRSDSYDSTPAPEPSFGKRVSNKFRGLSLRWPWQRRVEIEEDLPIRRRPRAEVVVIEDRQDV